MENYCQLVALSPIQMISVILS